MSWTLPFFFSLSCTRQLLLLLFGCNFSFGIMFVNCWAYFYVLIVQINCKHHKFKIHRIGWREKRWTKTMEFVGFFRIVYFGYGTGTGRRAWRFMCTSFFVILQNHLNKYQTNNKNNKPDRSRSNSNSNSKTRYVIFIGAALFSSSSNVFTNYE